MRNSRDIVTSAFLDFVRVVVDGDLDEVSRRLAASPALATASSDAGATRQNPSTFFFADIAHYLYAGDTALHMAAAAFRRPVAEILVVHGANCRARNRRRAEPLHYAADANRWNPTAQAETIEYLVSVGADPNAVDSGGVTPLHRAVRTRSLPAVRALLDGGANTENTEQHGVNALAPCRSNHRERRERLSPRARTTGRHRQAADDAWRKGDRPGQAGQRGASGRDQRMDSSIAQGSRPLANARPLSNHQDEISG